MPILDTFYEYHNNPPAATRDILGDTGPCWLWIYRTAQGDLQPMELGPMPFDRLLFALDFLKDESAREVGTRSFTDAEEKLLADGAELLLEGIYESGDASVGMDGCFCFEVSTENDLPRFRKAVILPEPSWEGLEG